LITGEGGLFFLGVGNPAKGEMALPQGVLTRFMQKYKIIQQNNRLSEILAEKFDF